MRNGIRSAKLRKEGDLLVSVESRLERLRKTTSQLPSVQNDVLTGQYAGLASFVFLACREYEESSSGSDSGNGNGSDSSSSNSSSSSSSIVGSVW
uniref:Uncharacterized protein n=1 Tax=Vespula pensylvanica TaxID=30213 RepID=A0A834N785_VESPE|nr:hypothetical protein H0235_016485 [Vespula pensylvanica]